MRQLTRDPSHFARFHAFMLSIYVVSTEAGFSTGAFFLKRSNIPNCPFQYMVEKKNTNIKREK